MLEDILCQIKIEISRIGSVDNLTLGQNPTTESVLNLLLYLGEDSTWYTKMGSFMRMISILCGAVVLCKGWEIPYAGQNGMNAFKKSDIADPATTAQTVGNPLPSAFFEEQITGGRHPDDDKRYTVAQLNQAARHRNVYFDTVGGDPYGHSSTVLTRSHIATNKKRRSIMGAEAPQNVGGNQLPSAFFQEQTTGGRHPNDDKRYTVAQLNQAARHRNVYFDTVGGDPYGHSSTVLTRSHIATNSKKRRSVSQAGSVSAPGAISQYFPAVRSSPPSVQPAEKRDSIARLNYAARHRNVYFDSVGGDPYGSSSTVLTRQHILIHHNKRSTEQEETKTEAKKACHGCCCHHKKRSTEQEEMKTEETLKKKLRLD
ncbi:hypothetical protein OS493_020992 [Desmophyllum pertusum]|uniref:Uncharacterized protein n=1 Tax=Desmophyllum pertusum TaxID=174260 RepID=A0A9X0D869_9CNID|nr:hypothetical protein OS493_020992 [Desmophyllum pertusum]